MADTRQKNHEIVAGMFQDKKDATIAILSCIGMNCLAPVAITDKARPP
ncbi:hypothetical protein [Nitrosopumilus sp.]|nr:hypothetical protein [Nitrosopumilus sp.]